MNDPKSRLSRRYPHSIFASVLPDGIEVPWRTLSLGEFLEYLRDISTPPELRENDIFLKCVDDDYLKNNIAVLKAGTVSTVAQNIIDNSFPPTADESNLILNFFRYQLQATTYPDLILMICNAFPAYSPKDIMEMHYEDFMFHIALAEKQLAQKGLIDKPIEFLDPVPEGEQQKPEYKPKPIDSKQLKSMHDVQTGNAPPMRLDGPVQLDHGVYHTPCPQATGEKFVVKKDDIKEGLLAADTATRADYEFYQDQMVADTAKFYEDYLEIQQKDGRITPDHIKSPEQREKEALERMKANEVKLQHQVRRYQEAVAAEDKRLEERFAKGQGKRKTRRRRK
jgi:hypothetical protein